MSNDSLAIEPNVGWGTIRLGAASDNVLAELKLLGWSHDTTSGRRHWCLSEERGELFFLAGNPERLNQIVLSDRTDRVFDREIVGQPIDAAISALGVKQFGETAWSSILPHDAYRNGERIDQQGGPKVSSADLIRAGTLWIKSLGIGLILHTGVVTGIALRYSSDVPQEGHGPLRPEELEAAMIAATRVPEKTQAVKPPNTRSGKISFARRVVFSFLCILFLLVPGVSFYRDYSQWQKALSVTGKVVEIFPDSPFPEKITVEYAIPEGKTFRTTIGYTYTTAREVGQEVDLIYLPHRPERAMTRIQSSDEGFTIPPMYMFGSVAIAMFCLQFAFPEYIRLNSRRR